MSFDARSNQRIAEAVRHSETTRLAGGSGGLVNRGYPSKSTPFLAKLGDCGTLDGDKGPERYSWSRVQLDPKYSDVTRLYVPVPDSTGGNLNALDVNGTVGLPRGTIVSLRKAGDDAAGRPVYVFDANSPQLDVPISEETGATHQDPVKDYRYAVYRSGDDAQEDPPVAEGLKAARHPEQSPATRGLLMTLGGEPRLISAGDPEPLPNYVEDVRLEGSSIQVLYGGNWINRIGVEDC